MNSSERPSRRGFLVKLGLLLNGIAGAALAVPIVRYLLSPMIQDRNPRSRAWVSLGAVTQFPTGQTRYATVSPGPCAMPPLSWSRAADAGTFGSAIGELQRALDTLAKEG